MTAKPTKRSTAQKDRPLINPNLIASIIGRLRVLDTEIKRHSAMIEAAVGINYTEGLFLRLVCAIPGQSLSTITEKMMLTQGAASNVKRILMRRGFIAEQVSPEDARVILLYPTKEAHQFIKKASIDVKTPLRQIAEETDPEDLRRFNELLVEITDRIFALNAAGSKKQDAPQRKGL